MDLVFAATGSFVIPAVFAVIDGLRMHPTDRAEWARNPTIGRAVIAGSMWWWRNFRVSRFSGARAFTFGLATTATELLAGFVVLLGLTQAVSATVESTSARLAVCSVLFVLLLPLLRAISVLPKLLLTAVLVLPLGYLLDATAFDREPAVEKPPPPPKETSFRTATGRLNPELESFETKPDDQVWRFLDLQNVGDYQHWFEHLATETGLDQFYTLARVPDHVLGKLVVGARKAKADDGIHPPALLLICCLFVQADTVATACPEIELGAPGDARSTRGISLPCARRLVALLCT